MVDSKDGWIAAQTFAEKVMMRKEEQERRFEMEARSETEKDIDSY